MTATSMTTMTPRILHSTDANDLDAVRTVDPRIIGTQQTFRIALVAMTTPGRIGQLTWEPELSDRIAGPDRWLAALLLALADHEVSLAVELADRSASFAGEITRWTRTASVAPEAADLVVADADSIDPNLAARLRRGSLPYPDDSALLIVQVGRLGDAPNATTLDLRGPGVDGRIALLVDDLSPGVIVARNVAVSQYPTGIDLLLVDHDGRIAGIPRTTVITIIDGEVS